MAKRRAGHLDLHCLDSVEPIHARRSQEMPGSRLNELAEVQCLNEDLSELASPDLQVCGSTRSKHDQVVVALHGNLPSARETSLADRGANDGAG
jgi:hypothetical protein